MPERYISEGSSVPVARAMGGNVPRAEYRVSATPGRTSFSIVRVRGQEPPTVPATADSEHHAEVIAHALAFNDGDKHAEAFNEQGKPIRPSRAPMPWKGSEGPDVADLEGEIQAARAEIGALKRQEKQAKRNEDLLRTLLRNAKAEQSLLRERAEQYHRQARASADLHAETLRQLEEARGKLALTGLALGPGEVIPDRNASSIIREVADAFDQAEATEAVGTIAELDPSVDWSTVYVETDLRDQEPNILLKSKMRVITDARGVWLRFATTGDARKYIALRRFAP